MGNSLTIQALKAMIAKDKPDLLFLSETKNSETMIQWLQKQLHFSSYYVWNPVGQAGGLAVFWTENISVDIELVSEFYIDMICR